MLRLFKMAKNFNGFSKWFVNRDFLKVMKFLKIFCSMLMVAHLAACGWFFVGYATVESDSGSWVSKQLGVDEQALVDEMSVFTKYSFAWYWAVVTVCRVTFGCVA